ncbi:Mammalian cell entry related domain protein [Chthoniobacter flavus Ellin428]|uniref:Mammalian cell entry related domain protein n=1 Tax=Chthoniobacter flavus Ellin428 TaxID=497964 RepID=B4CTT9_9BACT|nr:MlaD family protein [Chthoniobacter flavus]EDY21977.1 Mammalian cell entry related domain protein [Chthoniobacter flavus Ellin428]TCO89364.1 ABC-type transporter Mla subunit MlaD [Chthoniobacter flavus]
MSTERKGVEFFVGLFLLVGLGVVAGLVVTFGRAGQGLENFYTIRVRFPNASGLVKNADVLLSGARIGLTKSAPTLVGENYEVEVELSIRETVRIPRKAQFQIRSNGMLGDSYIDVIVPPNFAPNDFAEPGELITGKRTGGLDELTTKGSQMIDTLNTDILRKLSEELDEIKQATASINQQLLSKQNLNNLQDTLANLKSATADFSKASKDLDLVVTKSQEAVDSAKLTLKTVDGAAGDLRLGIGDFRKVADSAHSLLNKANAGDGTLGMLLADKQTAENLRALIANLRRSGVLFYKDHPTTVAEVPATPTPRPKRH